MSDIVDTANDHAATLLDAAIRHKRKEGPKPTGKCLSCDEPLEPPRRWCNKECMEDYEHYNRK